MNKNKISKTIIALLILGTMLLSLMGCKADKPSGNNKKTNNTTINKPVPKTTKPENKGGTTKPDASATGLAKLVNDIYAIKNPGLEVAGDKVDLKDETLLKFYTGLKKADDIKEAYFSEPVISSQAYSLVIVKVKDASKAKDIAAQMKAGVNKNKWVCATAEDLTVSHKGDLVFLCMMDSSFGPNLTSQQLADAFQKVAA